MKVSAENADGGMNTAESGTQGETSTRTGSETSICGNLPPSCLSSGVRDRVPRID
jgi:hypothetical protein